jgi:Domain of unknown function DUF29
VEWADRTVELLRQGKFEQVNLEHLLEEVEGLVLADRHAVWSQLLRRLMHLIRERIQPERAGSSWRTSITGARQKILLKLEETRLTTKARDVKLPETCPYTVADLLDSDLDVLGAMLA